MQELHVVKNNEATETMTLKEITDLLDVRHNDAMITVAKMAKEPEFGAVQQIRIAYNKAGQTTETYKLDKRQSLAVSAKLNTAMLMRVIDRWQELEGNKQPLSRLELAKEQVRLIEELESTKEIVHKLEVELDESLEWASIKRVEAMTGIKCDWRVLKRIHADIDIERIDIFDANYGTVKAYHKDAWVIAYGVDIETMVVIDNEHH